MAGGRVRAAIDQVHRLIGRRDGVALSDAQLLADFVTDRDEKGFEVLVWRHGAMVLSLCRRVLGDVHDAEDAFQATFLVFARKAASIGRGESVGGWLYKVAYRVALRARATTARRRGQEEPIDDLPGLTPDDDLIWRDLRPVLDEEIDRLPVKYRVPFVLCYLEGRTNEEAAEEIGCPKGTILSRLSRGREQLRSRLARRGLTLSVGCLVTALSENAANGFDSRSRDSILCWKGVSRPRVRPSRHIAPRSSPHHVFDQTQDLCSRFGGPGCAGHRRWPDRPAGAGRAACKRASRDPGGRTTAR